MFYPFMDYRGEYCFETIFFFPTIPLYIKSCVVVCVLGIF
jgi:hypothetical protein